MMTTTLRRGSLTAALVLGCCAATAFAGCSADLGQNQDSATESNWGEVQAQKNDAVNAYLQANAVEFDWFKNNPIGFKGIPWVLLRALTYDGPGIPEGYEVASQFKDIWPQDWLGFANHPDHYEGGVLKPESERDHVLPYGMVFEDPESQLAIDKVFFSCGACHTGRVNVPAADGSPRIMHIFGAPNTEIDAQLYTWAVMETGRRLNHDHALADLVEDALDVWPGELFYKNDGFLGWKEKTAVDAAWGTVLEGLADGAQKAQLIYMDLPNMTGSYPVSQWPQAGLLTPPAAAFGPRIGQMDAYGIAAGLVVLHTKRAEYFEKMPSDHPFFDGLEGMNDKAKFELAGQRLRETAAEWMPQVAAPVDIASLYMLDERHHAGWDANQGSTARVIASGTSAVGDPAELNLVTHEMMNRFASELPAPAYPFGVDMGLAAKGEAVFEKNCGVCHHPNNEQVYTISQLDGIDDNRAKVLSPTARLGLIALMREACQGEEWCIPDGDTMAAQDEEFLRTIRSPEDRGYKADVLHGVWSTAPYLHNGSVPTLWHLLHPEARPDSFVRGNINYDTDKVGFVWDAAPEPGSYDGARSATYVVDPAQGRSNAGHPYGSSLDESEKTALLEYLKTL